MLCSLYGSRFAGVADAVADGFLRGVGGGKWPLLLPFGALSSRLQSFCAPVWRAQPQERLEYPPPPMFLEQYDSKEFSG